MEDIQFFKLIEQVVKRGIQTYMVLALDLILFTFSTKVVKFNTINFAFFFKAYHCIVGMAQVGVSEFANRLFFFNAEIFQLF